MASAEVKGQSAPAPAIHTVDLAKAYGGQRALSGLTLTVFPGEVFGFLGPNGAGKTTAMKLLLGLLEPTSGEGWMLGVPLGNVAARRKVGYLPERFRYQEWLTPKEVLRLHLALAGVPRQGWDREVSEKLETVGLLADAARRVGTFSKGMAQRLGLGVALLGDPSLVFLDEPTSALDPVGREAVRRIIVGLKEKGTAVFLNSHLLSEVEQVADRVAILDKGRVVAAGPLSDILRQSEVRVRVSGAPAAAVASFGEVEQEGDWIRVSGVDDEQIPAVVEALVAAGGRVHAVLPGRATLEERFLATLRDPPA